MLDIKGGYAGSYFNNNDSIIKDLKSYLDNKKSIEDKMQDLTVQMQRNIEKLAYEEFLNKGEQK